jgi:hypothetical protein
MYTKQIITKPDGSKYVQLTRIETPTTWTEELQITRNDPKLVK